MDGNMCLSALFSVAGALKLPPTCTVPRVCVKGHVHPMLLSSYLPLRMLVGAPWDGPSGDRRGDVYRCPIGGAHSAPCAKSHLGKTSDASPPDS